MRFCKLCCNMMYILEENKVLNYVCKNCNHTEIEDSRISVPIVENNYIDDMNSYSQYMTPHIKYDNTLPRVKNIKCPNIGCTKHADMDNEVIYIKYDQANMNYLYYCCHCEQFWKN